MKSKCDKSVCVPFHMTLWHDVKVTDDLQDHRHIFGENCKWKYRGFEGFMDDFGNFRYLPGNC